MMAEEFPDKIKNFLNPATREATQKCPSPACHVPMEICNYIQQQDQSSLDPGPLIGYLHYSDADRVVTKLILCGLLPACLEYIEKHKSDKRSCPGKAGKFCEAMVGTACNTDIPWTLSWHMRISLRSDLHGTSADWIGLAMLKIFLFAVRVLARPTGVHQQDPILAAHFTRLVARCLWVLDSEELDRELLQVGADEKQWREAMVVAQHQARSSSVYAWYITPDALPRVLQSLSIEDRALCQWMLRDDVFHAVQGWLASGAWKRSKEIAATAPSWARLRALLQVGCQVSSSSSGNTNNMLQLNEEWHRATLEAAANLRMRSHEERDGSKGFMCSAPGCSQAGSMKCGSCHKASYCSKDCQLRHWKLAHKEECKLLRSSKHKK